MRCQAYRIREKLRLGRTFGGHLLKARPASKSDQVAQGLLLLSVDRLQGWRLHSLFGQPYLGHNFWWPVLNLSCEFFFLISSQNFPCHNLWLPLLSLLLHTCRKSLMPHFLSLLAFPKNKLSCLSLSLYFMLN